MTKKVRDKKYKPSNKPYPNVNWYGEPNLGSFYDNREIKAVLNILKQSRHWHTGFGPNLDEIEKFEEDFARYCDVNHAIAISNNGDGFDMLLKTFDLTKKDEIILPALNYKAWFMVLIKYGVKLVFCDVDPITMNMDPFDLEKKINKNTRIICPVHYAGTSCNQNLIDDIAATYSNKYGSNIKVIYDAARAPGVIYKDSKVGSGGFCEIFSFHSAKLMTTMGEGGMITTNNSALNKKLKAMRSYGGENEWGMNYRMSKVQASFGRVQLTRLDNLNNLRRKVAKRRTKILCNIKDIYLPTDVEYSKNMFYLYPIKVNGKWGKRERNKIVSILENKYGIICAVPKFIHKRWKYIRSHYNIPNLPITEKLSSKVFCPIIHPKLNNKQQNYINEALLNVMKSI